MPRVRNWREVARRVIEPAGYPPLVAADQQHVLVNRLNDALLAAYTAGRQEGLSEGKAKVLSGGAYPVPPGRSDVRIADEAGAFRPLDDIVQEVIERAVAHYGNDVQAAPALGIRRETICMRRRRRERNGQ